MWFYFIFFFFFSIASEFFYTVEYYGSVALYKWRRDDLLPFTFTYVIYYIALYGMCEP